MQSHYHIWYGPYTPLHVNHILWILTIFPFTNSIFCGLPQLVKWTAEQNYFEAE